MTPAEQMREALPLRPAGLVYDGSRGVWVASYWVLDTLRAEGWDVVEEGEGDG